MHFVLAFYYWVLGFNFPTLLNFGFSSSLRRVCVSVSITHGPITDSQVTKLQFESRAGGVVDEFCHLVGNYDYWEWLHWLLLIIWSTVINQIISEYQLLLCWYLFLLWESAFLASTPWWEGLSWWPFLLTDDNYQITKYIYIVWWCLGWHFFSSSHRLAQSSGDIMILVPKWYLLLFVFLEQQGQQMSTTNRSCPCPWRL